MGFTVILKAQNDENASSFQHRISDIINPVKTYNYDDVVVLDTRSSLELPDSTLIKEITIKHSFFSIFDYTTYSEFITEAKDSVRYYSGNCFEVTYSSFHDKSSMRMFSHKIIGRIYKLDKKINFDSLQNKINKQILEKDSIKKIKPQKNFELTFGLQTINYVLYNKPWNMDRRHMVPDGFTDFFINFNKVERSKAINGLEYRYGLGFAKETSEAYPWIKLKELGINTKDTNVVIAHFLNLEYQLVVPLSITYKFLTLGIENRFRIYRDTIGSNLIDYYNPTNDEYGNEYLDIATKQNVNEYYSDFIGWYSLTFNIGFKFHGFGVKYNYLLLTSFENNRKVYNQWGFMIDYTIPLFDLKSRGKH